MNRKSTLFSKTPSQYRIQSYSREIISQDLIYKQNIHNIMQLPSIEKLVINSTSKSFIEDRKNITPTLLGLEMICGQKLKISVAEKSIAGFKIRQGQTIGCKVTLRKDSIYSFLDKLTLVILPRFNNFTALTLESFDKQANYTIGLNDLLLFPELETQFELFENLKGIDISFVMRKKNKYENLLLLTALQIPVQN
jgi:large subunit ribosomal protein L5